jgi:hypothetical protein
MSFDRLRIYNAGRFHEVDLPDWYHEACRMSEQEHVDWHRAFERVLDCQYTLLTEEGQVSPGLEIRFWPSEANGTLVPSRRLSASSSRSSFLTRPTGCRFSPPISRRSWRARRNFPPR